MATLSVRIDETLLQAARVSAKAKFRSVQSQIEYWTLLGGAAVDNPDLPVFFISESMMSLAEPREDSAPIVSRSGPASAPQASVPERQPGMCAIRGAAPALIKSWSTPP